MTFFRMEHWSLCSAQDCWRWKTFVTAYLESFWEAFNTCVDCWIGILQNFITSSCLLGLISNFAFSFQQFVSTQIVIIIAFFFLIFIRMAMSSCPCFHLEHSKDSFASGSSMNRSVSVYLEWLHLKCLFFLIAFRVLLQFICAVHRTPPPRPPRYYRHIILVLTKAQSVIFLFKQPL